MFKISYNPSEAILTGLEASEIDIGVLCPPSPLPGTVKVTHRFNDTFVLIAPVGLAENANFFKRRDRLFAWLPQQRWLMINSATNIGQRLKKWMKQEHLPVEPIMELDGFDLIINLVASGFGMAWVPRRTLALYRRKEAISIVSLDSKFKREVVVITRKHQKLPIHVSNFI